MAEREQWQKPSWNSRLFGKAGMKYPYYAGDREGEWVK